MEVSPPDGVTGVTLVAGAVVPAQALRITIDIRTPE
jgi:hypothetical protein